KERLAETARELAQQALRLQDRFGEDADDLVPYIVGGATRMQELVNDLLAYSRYANEGAAGAAALQSMLLSSSHTD
ncbi:MAG: PAS domain-containing sensor histidine kinase, partial [Planctomycetes bacterium]|nr:PAS domain-containing sensor histidine kinase [Planctomycetota bacterium]